MSKKFNLWILNHYAGNLRYGMEYRHFFLARHLINKGHRVGIVASSFTHLFSNPPKVKGFINFEVIDSVPFVLLRSPFYKGNGPKRLLNMLSYSLLARTKDLTPYLGVPTIILGSSPHPFVIWNILHLRGKYKIPALLEIRDLWPLMLIELGSLRKNHPVSWLFFQLEKMGFKKADRLISLWYKADEYMFKHGGNKNRYRYLPNGIELDGDCFEGEHPLLEDVAKKKEQGHFLVGYGGSHGYANPLPQVIEACRILKEQNIKDLTFFLVGDGPLKKIMMEQANSMKLDNLIFHDAVLKDVVMAFYKRLDATFIGLRDLPLFKYGPTPNKLMDYLSVGRPIIFAINSSFNPVEEIRCGISVCPEDGKKLAEVLIKMKNTPEKEREAMGRRGREYVEREFTYKSLANKLDSIIQEVL